MRPRVFPAEDDQAGERGAGQLRASMRPRVFPAEDLFCTCRFASTLKASMRPRVFPAEDLKRPYQPMQDNLRFNEAAGIPRGRLDPGACLDEGARAFNEAAGIPRGRPAVVSRCRPRSHSFNEAAGIPRGRPQRTIKWGWKIETASMRPRVFPAEDGLCLFGDVPQGGFNEAAGIPRGRRVEGARKQDMVAPRFNEAAGIPAEDVLSRVSRSSVGKLQ